MSDIIVKFKPQGHKGLIDAIRKLELAQKDATKGGKKFSDQTGRLRGSMSTLQNSFATVRSKLLLYNFALGMGISQMVKFAQQSAKIKNMERAFTSLAGSGEDAAVGISKLRSATQGTVSDFDLLQQANNAMVLGITDSTDQMADMFDLAKKLGDALGRDAVSSVESLVTGIGRQSRLMLDNIGIIVKSEDAYQKYALANNLVASELTDTEKKQAFMNAALEAARKTVAQLGPSTKKVSDQFARFSASTGNLANSIGSVISPLIGNMADAISDMIDNITQSELEKFITTLRNIGAEVKVLQTLQDQLSMQEATDNLVKNSEQFQNEFSNMEIVFKEAFSEETFNTIKKAYSDMGANIQKTSKSTGRIMDGTKRNVDSLSISFGSISELTQEDVTKGINVLNDEMTKLALSTKDLDYQKNKVITAMETDKDLSDAAIKSGKRVVADLDNKIKKNNMMRDSYMNQWETLSNLLTLVVGYEEAQRILGVSTDGVVNSIKNENETLVINEVLQKKLQDTYNESIPGIKAMEAAKIAQLDSDIKLLEKMDAQNQLTAEQSIALNIMKQKYNELTDAEFKNAERAEANRQKRVKAASTIAMIADSYAGLASAVGATEKQVLGIQAIAAVANAYKAASDTWADSTIQPTWLRFAAAASHYVAAYANVRGIYNQIGKIDSASGGGGGGGVSLVM